MIREGSYNNIFEIIFRNDYSSNAPSFTAMATLSIGTGKEEWGAKPGKEYYILKIMEIKELKNHE